jgi:type 1 glutamine amidotransferase/sugar phosphate isomerase/epimerase
MADMNRVILLVTLPLTLALSSQAGREKSEQADAFRRAPDALERVTWRTRTLVGDDRLTRWKFGIAAAALRDLTFLDAVVRADAAGVSFIEGSRTQTAGAHIPKNLDENLTDAERAALQRGMGDGVRMLTYRVETLGADAGARRRTFAFAKAMGADAIVAPLASTPVAEIDSLAQELGIDVALLGRPDAVMKALAGRSPRLRVAADTGSWMEDGLLPKDAVSIVKDRLSYLRLRDRSAIGPSARDTMLGQGVGRMPELFHELNRLNLRPLILMLDTTGVVNAPADLFRAVEAFEEVVQPAYGIYFTELSRSAPVRRELVRSGPNEQLLPDYIRRTSDELQKKIEAAIPRRPYATPRKPRKLLVIDACIAGMSHSTIPHANQMLSAMGRITGAWDTELNNDLNNLKYPRIKEYDGVFLNSNVGELLPDPAVREGLARFVREGGGLGGVHGTPWASRNWDEFGEMIGAKAAPHRIEQGVLRPYDLASPIVKPFGGKPLAFREEYYRFQHEGASRLQWEDVRVLLAVDLDNPDIEPRPWNGYKRPDNIYPVTWIRRYGQGRMFYCSLGHVPETFMTPEIVGHFLAGVQFLLGDLEADTTPNPPAGTARR